MNEKEATCNLDGFADGRLSWIFLSMFVWFVGLQGLTVALAIYGFLFGLSEPFRYAGF